MYALCGWDMKEVGEKTMHWILPILFFMHSVIAGQQSLYGESCRNDVDCLSHLSCMEGVCNYLEEVPSTETCGSNGATFTVRRGESISIAFQCPPDCAFEDHTLFGPICQSTPEGCERSQECKLYGICGYKDGECVISAEGCANSSLCSVDGKCGFDGVSCLPTAEGCQQSENCTTDGLCGFNGAICVVTPDYCFQSQDCKDIGICAFDGYKCVANAEYCTQSKICKEKGVCGYDGNKCIVNAKGCSESKRCQSHGTCGYQEAFGCMPTEAGCQNSSNCKEYDNCFKGYYGCIRK